MPGSGSAATRSREAEAAMTPLEKLWTIGYGLDLGGYEFEELNSSNQHNNLLWRLNHARKPKPALKRLLCWEDPEGDYFPFGDPRERGKWILAVLLISPGSGGTVFPQTFTNRSRGCAYRLLSQGKVLKTDRDCICHGKLVEWTGAAGEPRKPEDADWLRAEAVEQKILVEVDDLLPDLMWEGTGSTSDRPYPSCDRCGGDGSVISPGGVYAWYEVEDA